MCWLAFAVILAGCKSEPEYTIIKTSYYENGKVKEQIGKFVDSTNRYFVKFFYKNGNLNCLYYLSGQSNGQLFTDGSYFCLYANGDTLSYGNHKNGKSLGVRKAFYENGQLGAFEVYRNDSIAEYIYWDSTGQLDEYRIAYLEKNFFICKYDPYPTVVEAKGSPFFMAEYSGNSNVIEGYIIQANEPHLVKRELEVIRIEDAETQQAIDLNSNFTLNRLDSLFYTYKITGIVRRSYFVTLVLKSHGAQTVQSDTFLMLAGYEEE